ncbi:hypothetical protein SDC49_20585 [Lactobacillus sp. R2/2]|nr:hypothetical protein [Lactobacillus sp. R2/2]
MKSKFKLGDALLLIGTLAVFILSIVLWIFIMTNDQYFHHISQPSRVTEQAKTGGDALLLIFIFLPTLMALEMVNSTVYMILRKICR